MDKDANVSTSISKDDLAGVLRTICLFLDNIHFDSTSSVLNRECLCKGLSDPRVFQAPPKEPENNSCRCSENAPMQTATPFENSEKLEPQENSQQEKKKSTRSNFTEVSSCNIQDSCKDEECVNYKSLQMQFHQLNEEHHKLMSMTAELTAAFQNHIAGQTDNLNSVLSKCRCLYPDIFERIEDTQKTASTTKSQSSLKDAKSSKCVFSRKKKTSNKNKLPLIVNCSDCCINEDSSKKSSIMKDNKQNKPAAVLHLGEDCKCTTHVNGNCPYSTDTNVVPKGANSKEVVSIPTVKSNFEQSAYSVHNAVSSVYCGCSPSKSVATKISSTNNKENTIMPAMESNFNNKACYSVPNVVKSGHCKCSHSKSVAMPVNTTNSNLGKSILAEEPNFEKNCYSLPNVPKSVCCECSPSKSVVTNGGSDNIKEGPNIAVMKPNVESGDLCKCSSSKSVVSKESSPTSKEGPSVQLNFEMNCHTVPSPARSIYGGCCSRKLDTQSNLVSNAVRSVGCGCNFVDVYLKCQCAEPVLQMSCACSNEDVNVSSSLSCIGFNSSTSIRPTSSEQLNAKKISFTNADADEKNGQVACICCSNHVQLLGDTTQESLDKKEHFENFTDEPHYDDKKEEVCTCTEVGTIIIQSFELDFNKLKNDLRNGNDCLKMGLLRALRMRITQNDAKNRDKVINSYIRMDLLDITSGVESIVERSLCQSGQETNQYLLQESMARLINTFASLTIGRDYLCQTNISVEVLVQLIKSSHRSKTCASIFTQDMLIATLQKLTLRNQQRMLMISLGVVEHLISYLLTNQTCVSTYFLEYSTALLMNLCLHQEARARVRKDPIKVIHLLTDLMNAEHQYCMPYINGIMYSLFSDPSINRKARQLSVSKFIELQIERTDGETRQQLQFILEEQLGNHTFTECVCPATEPQIEVDLLEPELDCNDIATHEPSGEQLLQNYRLSTSQLEINYLNGSRPVSTPKTYIKNAEEFSNETDADLCLKQCPKNIEKKQSESQTDSEKKICLSFSINSENQCKVYTELESNTSQVLTTKDNSPSGSLKTNTKCLDIVDKKNSEDYTDSQKTISPLKDSNCIDIEQSAIQTDPQTNDSYQFSKNACQKQSEDLEELENNLRRLKLSNNSEEDVENRAKSIHNLTRIQLPERSSSSATSICGTENTEDCFSTKQTSRCDTPNMSYSEEDKKLYHIPSSKNGIFNCKKTNSFRITPPSFITTNRLPLTMVNKVARSGASISKPVSKSSNHEFAKFSKSSTQNYAFTTCYRDSFNPTDCNTRCTYECNCYNVLKEFVGKNCITNKERGPCCNIAGIAMGPNTTYMCYNCQRIIHASELNMDIDKSKSFGVGCVEGPSTDVPETQCQWYKAVFGSRPKVPRTPP